MTDRFFRKAAPRFTLFLALLVPGLALTATSADRTFVMATSIQPIEWNPLKTYSAIEAQMYTAVYEGLMTYNPANLKPTEGVSDNWTLSNDKRIYRFHLRSDARFSDGSSVTATVFRNSWLRLLLPSTNSPFAGLLDPIKGAAEYRTGKNKNPESVAIRAINDQTLEVELNQPTAYFIQLVCHQSLVPIHPALLDKPDWKDTAAIIGNGPYKFDRSGENRLDLVPNPQYWDRATLRMDRLVIEFSDDADAITQRFNAGETQWIESGANYNTIGDPFSFQLTPQFSTTFMYFSAAKPAFANPLVRKGLTLLLPLEEMRSKELFLVPSAQLIPGIPYYPKASSLEKQDIPEGLRALESAGFPKGKGLPPIVIELPKTETWSKISEMMKTAWKDLQVQVIIKEIDSDQYFDLLDPKEFTIASISWIGDYADPMTFLDLWNSQSSLNRSAFASKEYDALLADSNTQQGQVRYKTLAKAEELLLLGAAVLPINHSPAFNVINMDLIDGWYENPLNVHPFKYFQFKELKPPRNVARL